MYFDQDFQSFGFRGCGRVEFLGKSDTVHRIHAIEQIRSAACFVALKMTDQMPRRIEICDGRLLRFPLLNAILAEMAQPEFVGGTNRSGGKRLGDSYKRDVPSCAASARG